MSRKPMSWFRPDNWYKIDGNSLWIVGLLFAVCGTILTIVSATNAVSIYHHLFGPGLKTTRETLTEACELLFMVPVTSVCLLFLIWGSKLFTQAVRGFVHWRVCFSNGHTKEILLPRGKRPWIKSQDGVWYFGTPLDGWFHRVPMYFDEETCAFKIGPEREGSGWNYIYDEDWLPLTLQLEQIIPLFRRVGHDPFKASPFKRDGLVMNWVGLFLRIEEGRKTDALRLHDRDELLLERNAHIARLMNEAHEARIDEDERTDRCRHAYNLLLESSRLIYTEEGRRVAEALRQGLLRGARVNSTTRAELSRPLPEKKRNRRRVTTGTLG